MGNLTKAFAIAGEWNVREPVKAPEVFLNDWGREITRLEFAFSLAEMMLEQQGTPLRQGGIEISFSFMAEWDIATEHEREMRELCNAWTLDGGEPRAFMANVRGEKA